MKIDPADYSNANASIGPATALELCKMIVERNPGPERLQLIVVIPRDLRQLMDEEIRTEMKQRLDGIFNKPQQCAIGGDIKRDGGVYRIGIVLTGEARMEMEAAMLEDRRQQKGNAEHTHFSR